MLKPIRVAGAFLALIGSLTALALADPYADMAAFGQAYAAAKSYHMSVTADTGKTIDMDYVAPNKWHMTMGSSMEAIMIDPDMWVNAGGRWMHMTSAMGGARMQGMVSNVQNSVPHGDIKNDYKVTDLGMKDGYHAYDVTHNGSSDHSVIYLMPNKLPAKIEAFTGGKKSTIVYSKFNSPDISVSAPAQ